MIYRKAAGQDLQYVYRALCFGVRCRLLCLAFLQIVGDEDRRTRLRRCSSARPKYARRSSLWRSSMLSISGMYFFSGYGAQFSETNLFSAGIAEN